MEEEARTAIDYEFLARHESRLVTEEKKYRIADILAST